MKGSIDLIPPELRQRETTQRRITGWVGVVAAVVVALLIMTVALRIQIHRNQASILPLREQATELAAQEPRALSVRGQLQLITAQMKSTGKLLAEPDWNALIADVANASVPELWIAQCTFKHPVLNTEEPAAFTILGSAASENDLSGFISRLSMSPRLRDMRVQVHRSEAAPGEAPVEFSLQGFLNNSGTSS